MFFRTLEKLIIQTSKRLKRCDYSQKYSCSEYNNYVQCYNEYS